MGCSSQNQEGQEIPSGQREDQKDQKQTIEIYNDSNKEKNTYKIRNIRRIEAQSIYTTEANNNNSELLDSTLLDIENENNEKFTTFKNTDKNKIEGIKLKNLSQFYIYQKKDKIDSTISNQILMTFKNKINPFEENKIGNKKEIQQLKSEIKEFEKGYKNNIKTEPALPSFHINLTQKIKNNYNFVFKLTNIITNEEEEFVFNNIKVPLLFILLNHDFSSSIKKIKEITKFEKDKTFKLFLIIKKKEVHNVIDSLKMNNLNDCFIYPESNSGLIKIFGINNEYDSKCIFINKNGEMSLILENDIEFLTNEFIDFYLGRKSEQKFDNFDVLKKYKLKQDILEKEEFNIYLNHLKQRFNLEFEFRQIENYKYPVNIRFKYYDEDKNAAQEVIKHLKQKLDSYPDIKRYFIMEKVLKNEKQKINDYDNKSNELCKITNKNEELEMQLKKSTEELNYNRNKKKDLEKQLKEKDEVIQNLNKELSKRTIITIKKYGDEISLPILCDINDNFEILKKEYFKKYPQYERNAVFKYKNTILENSKTLNHYKIRNCDEIILFNN